MRTEGRDIANRVQAGDLDTALRIGIPRDAFPEQRGQPLDDFAVEKVRPLAEKAALVPAVNAARAMYGVLTAIVVIAVL